MREWVRGNMLISGDMNARYLAKERKPDGYGGGWIVRLPMKRSWQQVGGF